MMSGRSERAAASSMRSEDEWRERITSALAPFGWTCTDVFWQRYHSDPWVFNLANAVEHLHRLTEVTPDHPDSREEMQERGPL